MQSSNNYIAWICHDVISIEHVKAINQSSLWWYNESKENKIIDKHCYIPFHY